MNTCFVYVCVHTARLATMRERERTQAITPILERTTRGRKQTSRANLRSAPPLPTSVFSAGGKREWSWAKELGHDSGLELFLFFFELHLRHHQYIQNWSNLHSSITLQKCKRLRLQVCFLTEFVRDSYIFVRESYIPQLGVYVKVGLEAFVKKFIFRAIL